MKYSDDEKFMREAIYEAEKAVRTGDWPIGCVIELHGKVIARAHNTGYSTHNRLAHGEFRALEKARKLLEEHRHEATLYTTYEPYPMCVGAMIVMKIKRVVTGINPDDSGALSLLKHLPKFYKQDKFSIEVIKGVLRKECQTVFLKGTPSKKHADQYTLTLVR